jgi:hypothetical protein
MARTTSADATPTARRTSRPPGLRDGLGAVAVTGVLLFVAGLLSSGTEGPPVGQASADRIRAYTEASAGSIRLAVAVGLLAVVTLVVFTAALATRIRLAAPGSVLACAVAGAGLLIAVVQLLDVAATGVPRLLPGLIGTSLADVDDATLRGWYGLTGFTHFLGDLQMAPIAVVLLGTSIAGLRHRLVPRWLGWAGVVLGAAAALGVLGIALAVDALYPLWFTGLFGWWLWTLAVAIVAAVQWRRTD